MSYDLFLSSPRLNEQTFAQYFVGRAHYKELGWYANEDTGVYFQFSYNAEPFDERLSGGHAAFNLSYCRPHVFGLEAEPEVTAFVEAFDCAIHDPQMDGMGDGPYSATGFLRGWNRGNLFGYQAVGAKSDLKEVLLVDEGVIEAVWCWNLQRQTRQSELGEDRFLPRANWARRPNGGALVIFAVWGEGVRSAFPDCVTHVLLMRKRTVSKGWFKGKEEVMETKLVSLDEIAALHGCEWRDVQGSRLLLAPTTPPASPQIAAAFGGSFERGLLIERVSPDHVLDAALMAQARQSVER